MQDEGDKYCASIFHLVFAFDILMNAAAVKQGC